MIWKTGTDIRYWVIYRKEESRMKNWLKKGTAVFAALAVAAASVPSMAAEGNTAEKYEASRILENPTVTLSSGLTIQNGVTTDVLWTNTEGTQDFDFGPGGSGLEDAYILYEYDSDVKIDGINMIGWWPSDQGLKNISVYYKDEDGEWSAAEGMENYEIPWETGAGSNGATSDFANGERYHLAFTEPVVTSALKLQINSTYTSWSSKISMKLVAPVRVYTEAEKTLLDTIQELESYAGSVLTGELPGEFPGAAVEAVQAAVSEAEALFHKEGVTDEEIIAAAAMLKEAEEAFFNSQNPFPEDTECVIGLDNLEVVSGEAGFLNDRQISTGAVLAKTDASRPGYLIFDFGERELGLDQITILAQKPAEQGIKKVSIEYWDGAQWNSLTEKTDIGWEGGYERMEGRTILSDRGEISASKFRMCIEETNSGDGSFSVQEILVQGNEKVSVASLNELTVRAKEILEALDEAEANTKEADLVKFKLISATNEDTLARADQKKIDYLYAELLAALNQLDESVADKISPSDPLNVKVEKETEHSVTISFDPASDNRGVAGYKIYSGENIVADVPAPDGGERVTAEITGLADGTRYTFVIKAYDEAGNLSNGIAFDAETQQGEIPDVPDNPSNPDDPGQGAGDSPKSENSSGEPNGNKPYVSGGKAAKTGDSASLLLWAVILAAAGTAGGASVRASRRRK